MAETEPMTAYTNQPRGPGGMGHSNAPEGRSNVVGGGQDGMGHTNGTEPLEKDFSPHNGSSNYQTHNSNGYRNTGYSGDTYHQHLDSSHDSDMALKRIRTAGSISISPELFEKLYLSPQNAVKGDLRKTFGNPTPVCIVGFLISLTPLTCDLMGWRGAGGSGAASTGVYFFFGGLLMTVGGFLEFILGNTFPFVVFMSFGAFWLAYGATLQPFYNAYGAYAPPTATGAAGNPAEGLTTEGFNASLGFFLVFMGVLCFVYLICALRTNLVFVVIFFTLVLAFGCLTAAFWYTALAAQGNTAAAANAGRCLVAGGACAFVTCMAGWYLLFVILLASVDFPFNLPVGDLSTMIPGGSEKQKRREDEAELDV